MAAKKENKDRKVCECGGTLGIADHAYVRTFPWKFADEWEEAKERALHPERWVHCARLMCRSCYAAYWQPSREATFTRRDGSKIHLRSDQIIAERGGLDVGMDRLFAPSAPEIAQVEKT